MPFPLGGLHSLLNFEMARRRKLPQCNGAKPLLTVRAAPRISRIYHKLHATASWGTMGPRLSDCSTCRGNEHLVNAPGNGIYCRRDL